MVEYSSKKFNLICLERSPDMGIFLKLRNASRFEELWTEANIFRMMNDFSYSAFLDGAWWPVFTHFLFSSLLPWVSQNLNDVWQLIIVILKVINVTFVLHFHLPLKIYYYYININILFYLESQSYRERGRARKRSSIF